MKRRTFIKSGLAALGLTAVGSTVFLQKIGLCYAAPSEGFIRPLAVPPLLDYTSSAGDAKEFTFSVQSGRTEFLPGLTTPTMGYNGTYLGPTIKVRTGDKVRFLINNTLTQPTTVHWHGLHVPAEWDGGPRQVIAAGTTWKPHFTIKQPAATLWYHPHALGLTGKQVYSGLGGMFLIEDEESDRLALPSEYGINDFPLVLQDRRFYKSGEFAYAMNMMDIMHGVIGNYLLVNGGLWPNLDVPGGLVRLRVLNGSNSTTYRIGFSDNRTFMQVATDGGFQERPVARQYLLLSPGERSEIIVDFSGDKRGASLSLLVDQLPGNKFEAMQFTVRDAVSGSPEKVPEKLTDIDWLKESNAQRTRHFVMETMSGGMSMMRRGGHLTINGKNMGLGRIDETVQLGDTEIWEIENYSAMMMQLPHSMHLHDVQFQILDRNGKRVGAHERGRKDTVLVAPGERVRIITRFEDYAGIYMYHCHMLEHEDNGMMGQFEIVES